MCVRERKRSLCGSSTTCCERRVFLTRKNRLYNSLVLWPNVLWFSCECCVWLVHKYSAQNRTHTRACNLIKHGQLLKNSNLVRPRVEYTCKRCLYVFVWQCVVRDEDYFSHHTHTHTHTHTPLEAYQPYKVCDSSKSCWMVVWLLFEFLNTHTLCVRWDSQWEFITNQKTLRKAQG